MIETTKINFKENAIKYFTFQCPHNATQLSCVVPQSLQLESFEIVRLCNCVCCSQNELVGGMSDKHLVCLPWCRQALGVCLCGAGMLVMHGVIWVTKEQFGLWKVRQATGITSMCTAGVWIRVPLIMKLVMCCNMQALHSYLFQSLLKLKGLIFSGRTEERTWINSRVIMRLFWSSGMGAIIALP